MVLPTTYASFTHNNICTQFQFFSCARSYSSNASRLACRIHHRHCCHIRRRRTWPSATPILPNTTRPGPHSQVFPNFQLLPALRTGGTYIPYSAIKEKDVCRFLYMTHILIIIFKFTKYRLHVFIFTSMYYMSQVPHQFSQFNYLINSIESARDARYTCQETCLDI